MKLARKTSLLLLTMMAAIGAALAAAWWFAATASAQTPTGPERQAGEIVDFSIRPPTAVIHSGDTVTFTNNGDRPHTVTDRGGMFDTNPILPGETGTFTPDVPGTYAVFCRINPAKMNATIVVKAREEAPVAVRIQALDEQREGATRTFDPVELEVASGTRLVLANVGGLPHSLRAADDSFRIPVIEPGAEAGRFAGGNSSTIVTTPGTHPFFCEIHPAAMKGTLTVRPAASQDANRAPPPTTTPPNAESAPQTANAGRMVDFDFSPSEIVVQPGASVTWTNAGKAAHTATFDDVKLDTGRVEPSATASLVAPTKPGTYSYLCTIHPKMRGALRVSAPAVAAVAPPPKPDKPADGTLFAYALAALFVATGAAGLGLGLRRKSLDPAV